MKKNKNIIVFIVIVTLALAGFALLGASRPSGGPASLGNLVNNQSGSSGSLVVSEASYDFGTISMRRGNVQRVFTVKNTSQEAVTVTKLYTSCMCTTATLVKSEKKIGPFGMPGHGFMPSIKETLAPQEEVEVEVIFDPAAHGPSGIGRIERLIYVENDAGSLLTFGFTATVTP